MWNSFTPWYFVKWSDNVWLTCGICVFWFTNCGTFSFKNVGLWRRNWLWSTSLLNSPQPVVDPQEKPRITRFKPLSASQIFFDLMDLFFTGKSDDSFFAAMDSATNAIASVLFVCGFEISMESSYLVETKFFTQKNILTLKLNRAWSLGYARLRCFAHHRKAQSK